MYQIFSDAFMDIRAGIRFRRVWWALASEDVGDQHRRTTLGPVWLLLNYLAFAGTFIFVFDRGSVGIPSYEAYVAIGLFVWFYMMEVITQSIALFVREDNFIKGTTLPLTVYVMRQAAQSVIRAAYALAGCVVILAVSGTGVSIAWLCSAVGLLVILGATPAVITVAAFLGAYLPDSQFVVSNLMRIGMFLTPIFWAPGEGHTLRNILYHYNPFTYFLEIARVPVLTGNVPWRSFGLCTAIGLALWLCALILLGRLRKKVVFVL